MALGTSYTQIRHCIFLCISSFAMYVCLFCTGVISSWIICIWMNCKNYIKRQICVLYQDVYPFKSLQMLGRSFYNFQESFPLIQGRCQAFGKSVATFPPLRQNTLLPAKKNIFFFKTKLNFGVGEWLMNSPIVLLGKNQTNGR